MLLQDRRPTLRPQRAVLLAEVLWRHVYGPNIGRRREPSPPPLPLIQQTWSEILGIDAIGPNDDFFELGGYSLLAASAVVRLGQRLGRELPPHALFEAPTPEEMAELIADLDAEPRADAGEGVTPFFPTWVVLLQPEGAGRPVFVFPAGHNENVAMAIEAQVASHVGREHPFWGFGRDDPGLHGAREAGIAAMAAEYVVQMRAVQERGPYLLYANCAGAPYAWDVARQLLGDGEAIAGMLFYEAPLRRDAVLPLAATIRMPVPSIARTEDEYRPPPLPVDLTLLMTRYWWERQWSAPWCDVALGGVETVVIPGETAPAFDRREARIARHVREWIETAERRVRDGSARNRGLHHRAGPV
jgi:hypothetical protein